MHFTHTINRLGFLVLFLIFYSQITTGQSAKKNVDVGIYVEDIYGIDYQNSNYKIVFWIWVNSDDGLFDFTKNLDISNCAEIEISSMSYDSLPDKRLYHSECKIMATILNEFNVVNYPFDFQKLNLRIELANYTDQSEYTINLDPNSKLTPEFIQDWTINMASHEISIKNYDSNFGALESDDPLEFPGLNLIVELKRNALSLFFKSFLTLFVSIVLASVSFFYPNNCSEEKIGLIIGSLFTTVGNKYVTDGYLPLTDFNLSDKLHLLTIALITIIAFYAIIEQRFKVKDNLKTDIISFSISLIVFSTFALILTYYAVIAH